jgi:hypothetical protein
MIPQVITRWTFDSPPTQEAIPPHSSRFLSVFTLLNQPAEAIDQEMFDREVQQFAAFYSSQSEIDISVQVVVFEGGEAIGPDEDGWIPKLQAWSDAERDLIAMVSRTNESALGDALEKVHQIALQRLERKSQSASTPAEFFFAAGSAVGYQPCYDLAQECFAAQLRDKVQRDGAKAAIQSVRDFAARKRYSEIRIKGER